MILTQQSKPIYIPRVYTLRVCGSFSSYLYVLPCIYMNEFSKQNQSSLVGMRNYLLRSEAGSIEFRNIRMS